MDAMCKDYLERKSEKFVEKWLKGQDSFSKADSNDPAGQDINQKMNTQAYSSKTDTNPPD